MTSLPQTVSYLGKPLPTPAPAPDTAAALEAECREKLLGMEEHDSPGARVAAAAALRAIGEYKMALRVLTIGLLLWPDDAQLLTSRGHTYVNARSPQRAFADLSRAVQLDPTSFGAWYHLGLANWFLQDWHAATGAFQTASEVTGSASSRLAADTWRYTSLIRAGEHHRASAFLPEIDWDVDLEGRNYNYQLRARFYQGSLTEDELIQEFQSLPTSQGSLGFGLGIWYLAQGATEKALKHFQAAAESPTWPAFGVAAAELELALLQGATPVLPETHSLLGEPLFSALAVRPEDRATRETAVASARAAYDAAPDDTNAMRSYAKSLAGGLMEFNQAINFLDARLADHPDEAGLLCDRGHYKLNIREFESAERDLRAAAARQQDNFDIWYHLGLAHWFRTDYEGALASFRKALATCDPTTEHGESHIVAVSDWIFLALSRMGKLEEAQGNLEKIHSGMRTTMNNHLYLKRLLFYKGEYTEGQVREMFDQGGLALASYFGLGCWHSVYGDKRKANEYYEKVVREGTVWPGWAHIASEVELQRSACSEASPRALPTVDPGLHTA